MVHALITSLKDTNIAIKILCAIIAIAFIFFCIKAIERVVAKYILNKLKQGKQRTLALLLQNIGKYIFLFVASMIILETLGISTSSILAVAGIGGVAISWGSQSLIKDVISGLFIITENQFNVGDIVRINNNNMGRVLELDVRTTRVKNIDNSEVYIIPNGQITTVTNMSQQNRTLNLFITLPLQFPVEKVLKKMKKIVNQYETNDYIVKAPWVVGISSANLISIEIRIDCVAITEKSWKIERDLRKYILDSLGDTYIVK